MTSLTVSFPEDNSGNEISASIDGLLFDPWAGEVKSMEVRFRKAGWDAPDIPWKKWRLFSGQMNQTIF